MSARKGCGRGTRTGLGLRRGDVWQNRGCRRSRGPGHSLRVIGGKAAVGMWGHGPCGTWKRRCLPSGGVAGIWVCSAVAKRMVSRLGLRSPPVLMHFGAVNHCWIIGGGGGVLSVSFFFSSRKAPMVPLRRLFLC